MAGHSARSRAASRPTGRGPSTQQGKGITRRLKTARTSTPTASACSVGRGGLTLPCSCFSRAGSRAGFYSL